MIHSISDLSPGFLTGLAYVLALGWLMVGRIAPTRDRSDPGSA